MCVLGGCAGVGSGVERPGGRRGLGGAECEGEAGIEDERRQGSGRESKGSEGPAGGGGGQSGESGEERRERDEAQRAPRARARARERIGSKARSYVSCALRFPPKVAEHAPCKLCSQPTRSLSARFFEATSWQARHVPKDV